MDSLTAESHAETLAKVTPLLEEGRHEEALPFFELHKSKSDDPIWSYLMALSLACLARGEEGLALLESAAQSEGFSSHFGISVELNTLVRTTALNHLMFETSVDSSDVGPWSILRRYAELLSHREFLAKAAVGFLKAEPESREAVTEFLRLFEDAPPDKVIPVLDDIVNGNPSACQPRALLGSFLQQRGKTALAIRHLKTAVDSDPNAMEPHLYLGKIYLAQARFDDAERELSEAMSKGSPTVALLVEVANCQKATYRYDEALQTMFTAFEIDPPTFRNWDLLVDTAQTSGQGDLLADKLRQATQKYPNDARLRQRFAMMAVRQDDPLAAREQLGATGIFENPTKDQALARLAAEVSWSLNDATTAVGLLEALWKASPNNPEACRVYGDALLNNGKAAEAETLLRETARNNPNDRALQISWGRALLAMGDAERAHRAFSLASRLDPDDAEAMAEQGRAMLVLGLHDEAQNVLKESAKKAEPPLAVTLVGLGAVYEKKGLKDISRDFFRQALLRQPEREEAGQGLVRTRPDDGSSTLASDVEEMIEQLKTPFARIRLWLNLLRGSLLESPEQAKALSQSVYPKISGGLTPEYASFLQRSEVASIRRLAESLEREGEPEKAREVWRYAVTSGRPELVEIASTELKRLDTYEAPAANSSNTEADGLASLFSDVSVSATPVSEPGAEADLFAEEAPPSPAPASTQVSPSSSAEEDDDVLAALFAVDVPEMASSEPEVAPPPAEDLFVSESQAPESPVAETELFVTGPSPTEVASAESAPSQAQTEELSLEIPLPPVEPQPSVEVVTPQALESEVPVQEFPPLVASEPDVPVQESPPLVASEPEAPVQETPPLVAPEPEAPTQETPEPEVAVPVASVPEAPLSATSEAEISETEAFKPEVSESEIPQTEVHEAPTGVPSVATLPNPIVPEKELLPIPMAADFSPLTRRQLHYHEALVSGGPGVLNPESLAHLLLQSAVGHEPPDPGSLQGQNSTALLSRALLTSAVELEQAQQFRGAVRVLRTALLYQPESVETLETLARVQSAWALWLSQRQEFAHAVSLVRDILARQPDNSEACTQLETLYRQWIDWSQAAGDTAASDLLAVYLDQEKTALQELRQAFVQARTQKTAPSTPIQAAPPVAPVAAPVTQPAAQPVVSSDPAATPEPMVATPAASPAILAPTSEAPEVAPPPPSESPDPAAPQAGASSVETPAPTAVPEETVATATPVAESDAMFENKEEAIETLDAAPDDESVAEAVFQLYADSMRDLTTLLKERSNSHPEQPAWLLLLARAFRRSGSETMAVIQYQKYIKVAPSPEAYEELAQTYEELGKDDFAKMTRRKAERA